MTISVIDNSQRTAAKVAGIALLFSMVIVVFANYGLLNPLLVRGNAAETARNIMAHETQFRVCRHTGIPLLNSRTFFKLRNCR